jgi:hypothetical protein
MGDLVRMIIILSSTGSVATMGCAKQQEAQVRLSRD